MINMRRVVRKPEEAQVRDTCTEQTVLTYSICPDKNTP